LAPLGVRAYRIAVETEALPELFGEKTDLTLGQAAEANPGGRNVNHDDDGSLIEFLAGPSAAMIRGQVIFVNGGAYLTAQW